VENTGPLSHQEYFLRPGYIFVTQRPTLISTVLGTSVAVALWDREKKWGGMNHFLYPLVPDPHKATAQFGNVAVRALYNLFVREGSHRRDLDAQIFGGAHSAEASPEEIEVSRRNIAVGLEILRKIGITVVSEDTGGTRGRKLVFNTATNEVAVFRAERLRDSDWYPYRDKR